MSPLAQDLLKARTHLDEICQIT